MNKELDIQDFQFKDTSFASLMTKRIHNVLLIATKYDSFILEDDGRIDEQIFNEYVSLNLHYPPRFHQVISANEALERMDEMHYDLVIQMPNMDEKDMFAGANAIKSKHPDIPFVVLTPFSKEVSKRLATEDLSAVDYIFSWLGNSDLLLAIIKLIEDAMNVESDTESVGVQVILLVEDSIRFYSSALPSLYKIVLEESKEFSKEALNGHQRMLRMRGRPKIMLARSYEEAIDIYNKYKDSMLGVITDMSYKHKGKKEKLAGYYLAKQIKTDDPTLPIIFNSSETENKKYADELLCSFIDKNSKTFSLDLKQDIKKNFGFGDFLIINPRTGEDIMRIQSLKDLQRNVFNIPDDSLIYHMSHDHFSRFFYSRAMFPIAELMKRIKFSDLKDADHARETIHEAIVKYRRMKHSGIVAVFDRDSFDEFSNFVRIGDGSLGGKGRSLAFMNNLVKEHSELKDPFGLPVRIPRTVVIATDLFDEFMEMNDLYPVALSDASDQEIFDAFMNATLPSTLVKDFMAFFGVINSPIAIRSSSLLEDAHYQPFAGVYSTYMIPYVKNKRKMSELMGNAVKAVYASVFYRESKTYMAATQNVIDQEKMAIVLQEVVGSQYTSRLYPTVSGVARSLNFYPVGNEKVEEGIVNMILGLGKYIVDGGVSLRFSPYHPQNILQLSSVDFALRDTQRFFYALDLDAIDKPITMNDGFNLLRLSLKDAEKDDSIRYISSTYLPEDQNIYDGYYEGGRKIISFASILQHNMFPLADTLKKVLEIGQTEMGRAVEIEFAMDVKDRDNAEFYLLQIRPIVHNKELQSENLTSINPDDAILYSTNALGHGISNDVHDVVYVKTKNFDASHNNDLASEIDRINMKFLEDGTNYILVGPGRWGSSDSWLGIPVKWSQISNARVLVEYNLDNYRVDPSQGTHFFQNLTSFGVGYFSINPFMNDNGVFDEEYLNGYPAIYESEHIRHVRFKNPIVVKIDGTKRIGVVLKEDDSVE